MLTGPNHLDDLQKAALAHSARDVKVNQDCWSLWDPCVQGADTAAFRAGSAGLHVGSGGLACWVFPSAGRMLISSCISEKKAQPHVASRGLAHAPFTSGPGARPRLPASSWSQHSNSWQQTQRAMQAVLPGAHGPAHM